MNFEVAALAGPYGGLLAGAFAVGATAGWGFCVKTIFKLAQKRLEEMRDELKLERERCDQQLDEMRNENRDLVRRVREIEDRNFTSQERQLGQVRVSSLRVIRDGKLEEPDA